MEPVDPIINKVWEYIDEVVTPPYVLVIVLLNETSELESTAKRKVPYKLVFAFITAEAVIAVKLADKFELEALAVAAIKLFLLNFVRAAVALISVLSSLISSTI